MLKERRRKKIHKEGEIRVCWKNKRVNENEIERIEKPPCTD